MKHHFPQQVMKYVSCLLYTFTDPSYLNIFPRFRKFDTEAASSDLPGDHGKKKSMSPHSLFFISMYCDTFVYCDAARLNRWLNAQFLTIVVRECGKTPNHGVTQRATSCRKLSPLEARDAAVRTCTQN